MGCSLTTPVCTTQVDLTPSCYPLFEPAPRRVTSDSPIRDAGVTNDFCKLKHAAITHLKNQGRDDPPTNGLRALSINHRSHAIAARRTRYYMPTEAQCLVKHRQSMHSLQRNSRQ